MHPTLHTHTIYRLASMLRGESAVYRYLREARGVQHLGPAELARRQGAELARLLAHAAAGSPFYRRTWGGAGAVSGEDALGRLASLPFIDKGDLQRHGAEMCVQPPPGRVATKSTGGSTGEPVRIVKDALGIARERAATWMALEWFGIGMGDRAVRFWGTPLTAGRRLSFALGDLAMNRIRLSAFDLDEEDLSAYWRRCLRFRPRWFYGYASLIHLFAEWIEGRGLDGGEIGLRAVVPTSEPLTTRQRATIGRVFGAPVQNEYGCGEVGAIAYECREGRLHVMPHLVVEVVTDGGAPAGPGEAGEIVVTDLANFAQPLVRFRMGDRATVGEPCPCGRPFPVLGEIQGRVHDVLYTPAGRRWHGEKVDYLMSGLGGFRQYQVVQDAADHVTVRLVADGPLPAELPERIRDYVAGRLDGMRATVVQVDRIERARSGKYRIVRNDWLADQQPHGRD